MPYLYQQDGEYYPKSFANQAEEALKRSKVLEQSIQLDALTGLYNRRYTEQHITRLLHEDHQFGLLLAIDLDSFKAVNDTLGHLAGDELLKKAAVIMTQSVPANAIIGRVGGDEFLIFLPGITDKPQGQATARRLLQGIDALEAPDLAPTCSIGITLAHGDQDTFHAAYKRADQALYQAKSHGKNGYCWYEDMS